MAEIADEMREWPRNGLVRAGDAQALLQRGAGEIDRLQEAKRRALAIADERGKENVHLRAAITAIRELAGRHGPANEVDALNEIESIAKSILSVLKD